MLKKGTRDRWILIPLYGTVLFVCLYLVSAFLYPGGSQANANSKGFSWINNYWCNLFNETAMNGEHNRARPVALISMVVLGITLASFWYIFPLQAGFEKKSRLAMQLSGIISMTAGMFIATSLHDTIINIAGLCALVAIIGTFAGLQKLRWSGLLWLGIFCMLLVAVNNILYYGPGLKSCLPLVQKMTFLVFLLWICLTDIKLFRLKRGDGSLAK